MGNFLNNIIAGARLALPFPFAAGQLRATPGQAWLLLCVALLPAVARDWWLTAEPRAFEIYALYEASATAVLVMAGAALVAAGTGNPRLHLVFPCAWFAAAFTVTGILALSGLALEHAGIERTWWWTAVLGSAWMFIVVWRSQAALAGVPVLRRFLNTTCTLLLLALPGWHIEPVAYWYTLPPEPDPAAAPAKPVDAERVLFDQRGLLDAALDSLAPQDTQRSDWYVVGFGAYDAQDVFLHEVAYMRNLAAGRFAAGDRFIGLVNHRATLHQQPLATISNLQYALQGISTRMDPEDDVLFLYLTSHGSEYHSLSVEMANLPLNQVHATELAEVLADLPIRWKVVVISACYAGGFIPALADAHTLVIAAAHAERQSFGCSSDATMTWFGRAFLQEGLGAGMDFEEAFDHARRLVNDWETEAGHDPSLPQISFGGKIREKLSRAGN